MQQAIALPEVAPMGEINTTPLIDVMLVLLIMFVITIPAATHSLEVPLPRKGSPGEILDTNQIVLSTAGKILWNGNEVTLAQLSGMLDRIAAMPRSPEVRFQPEGSASYGLAAEVLRRIKASGIETFGFVGMEAYSEFSAPTKR